MHRLTDISGSSDSEWRSIHKATLWDDAIDREHTFRRGAVSDEGDHIDLRLYTEDLSQSPFALEPVDVSCLVSTESGTVADPTDADGLEDDQYHETDRITTANMTGAFCTLRWPSDDVPVIFKP
jgi:hypothetical protein